MKKTKERMKKQYSTIVAPKKPLDPSIELRENMSQDIDVMPVVCVVQQLRRTTDFLAFKDFLCFHR